MTLWLCTGFPSPWRWARRRHYRRMYQAMTPYAQYVMNKAEADPRSLIARGVL